MLLALQSGVYLTYGAHDEQREFMRLLRKFVHLNDQQGKLDAGITRAAGKA